MEMTWHFLLVTWGYTGKVEKKTECLRLWAFHFPKCPQSFFNHFLWYRVGIWCVPTGNQNKNSIDFLCWVTLAERKSSKSKCPWLPLGMDTNFQEFTRKGLHQFLKSRTCFRCFYFSNPNIDVILHVTFFIILFNAIYVQNIYQP